MPTIRTFEGIVLEAPDADALIPGSSLDAKQKEELLKAIVGVFAVFLGVVVSGDPEKGDNPLWVSWHFKQLSSSHS